VKKVCEIVFFNGCQIIFRLCNTSIVLLTLPAVKKIRFYFKNSNLNVHKCPFLLHTYLVKVSSPRPFHSAPLEKMLSSLKSYNFVNEIILVGFFLLINAQRAPFSV
jgi:hypothetical protein